MQDILKVLAAFLKEHAVFVPVPGESIANNSSTIYCQYCSIYHRWKPVYQQEFSTRKK